MKKELKDYLHFYLGCDCQFEFLSILGQKQIRMGKLIEIDTRGVYEVKIAATSNGIIHTSPISKIKPYLRLLEGMTGEESIKHHATLEFQRATAVHVIGLMVPTAETFKWLLSKHFDIFNLIPEGLALTV